MRCYFLNFFYDSISEILDFKMNHMFQTSELFWVTYTYIAKWLIFIWMWHIKTEMTENIYICYQNIPSIYIALVNNDWIITGWHFIWFCLFWWFWFSAAIYKRHCQEFEGLMRKIWHFYESFMAGIKLITVDILFLCCLYLDICRLVLSEWFWYF